MKKILFPILIAITLLFSSCSITEPQTPTETTKRQGYHMSFEEFGVPITTDTTSAPETSGSSSCEPTEISVVYRLPKLSPSKDYPADKPLPDISISEEREVASFHILPNGDVWLMYTLFTSAPTVINELYTTTNGGVTWNKISHIWNGIPMDMFVIDDDHIIVLIDNLRMGYGFYVLENNGMDITAQYTSSKMLNPHNNSDYAFLFPTEFFESDDESNADTNFYKSVSAYYIEPIDDSSCKIVLECDVNGETVTHTAIYDANGVHR